MSSTTSKHILLLSTESPNRGGIQHVADYVEEFLRGHSEFTISTIRYNPAERVSFLRQVRAALEKADCVISMHLSLQLALLGSFVPTIQFIHGIELEHHPEWLTRLLLSRAETLFCSTQTVRKMVSQYVKDASIIFRSLYPSPLFCERFEHGISTQNQEILLVSRLTASDRYKGVWDVIELYDSENSAKLPNMKIVGDGDDRALLESMVHEKHLQNKISFLGLLSNKDLKTVFQSAAGFVLLSTKEGQGLVYVEALSYGLPVLALQNTVAEELIEHGKSGFLADKNDRESIKGYLQEMIENDELRKQARKRFEELRIEENFSQKLIQTLKKCAE